MPDRKQGWLSRFVRAGRGPASTETRGDARIAYQLAQDGRLDEAGQRCRDILRVDPGNPDANNCLGVVEQRLGHPERAVVAFEAALAAHPGYVPAYGNLANSLAQLGRHDEATRVVDTALKLEPDAAIDNWSLGELAYRLSCFDEAIAFYRRAIAADPGDFRSRVGLALSLKRIGRLDEALTHAEHAARLQPSDAGTCLIRGDILSDMGRLDDAANGYRRAVRLRPSDATAHQRLASVRKHTEHDADVGAMEALYRAAANVPADRAHLAFGLGKAFEDLQQYERAFDYYREANQLKRNLVTYSTSTDANLFARLEATFDRVFMERHRGMGREDDGPIFILGMLRSGTSLVEQILASHPLVYGAGELATLQNVCLAAVRRFPEGVETLLPDAWRDLAGDYLQRLARHSDATARHTTDKMPQNFLYVGMIATMLPNARIIHCRRDPMDTCLSLYKNEFASTGPRWCYDLEELGDYYRMYANLMEHWDRVLPEPMHHLSYENLVANVEPEVRRLLRYCNLPFDPACLNFHETQRSVQTLSFAQVRKPVYTSSVGLWKRFEIPLEPLRSRLDET